MNLAPIILFAYNRPTHLAKTLEALKSNILAKESLLFIFADGKNPKKIGDFQQVREMLKNLEIEQNEFAPFASVNIVYREENFGLADSIIQGINAVIYRFNKAIILEDDIVTSPIFLNYMNDALNRYENEQKVWSISAWSYPIDTQDLEDCYFWRSPHCWGWATWADRWQYFKRDIQWALNNFTKQDIDYINIDGCAPHYFKQVIANHRGKIKTWAIFNYLIAYKHNALTLCPTISYVQQIGFDNSGTHCGEEGEVLNSHIINTKLPEFYPNTIAESSIALTRIKAFEKSLKKSLLMRILRKVKHLLHIS